MTHCCNPHRVLTTLVLGMLLAVGGCGQKGPLVYSKTQQERVDARNKERLQRKLQRDQESGSQETDITPSPTESMSAEPVDEIIEDQESDLEDQ